MSQSNPSLASQFAKLTIDDAATWSYISMPASANATLAADIAAAKVELVPSFSSTLTYTSIDDLGKRSSRTAGVSACTKIWENSFSWASCSQNRF